MRKYLARCILFYCLYLSIPWQTYAQSVSHIKINESNAGFYRDSLIRFIFGTSSFPYDIQPDFISTNVNTIELYNGTPYTSILYPAGNLDSIDRIAVTIGTDANDFPEPAYAYLFHPHNSNGKLFIYHSGHCAGVAISEDIIGNNNEVEPGLVIPAMLDKGYTVLAVPMINYQEIPPAGLSCGYNNHTPLFLDGHYEHPLSFFFKPLIASLNFLGRSNYNAIYMCGLSGGGWTSSLYPALDSSVVCSFPVAGSLPVSLVNYFYSGGDYEQEYPALFAHILDYHEFYTLGCLAPARKMLQINNRYDECCFAGSTAHIYYMDSVSNALNGSGGNYKFYLDETGTRHAITTRALEVIFKFIANDTASLLVKPADTATCGNTYLYDIKNNFTVNTTSDNDALHYSLLKAPAWMSLDTTLGVLHGIVPAGNIFMRKDTVSFKVEDSTGRFVLYNYQITKKREGPHFYIESDESKTIYFIPEYSRSMNNINQQAASLFYFNNPDLQITSLVIDNNSVIRININMPLAAEDSIGYHGFTDPAAITYNNGLKISNFELTEIERGHIVTNFAKAGMIRFNTETKKFEYFNGIHWINLN